MRRQAVPSARGMPSCFRGMVVTAGRAARIATATTQNIIIVPDARIDLEACPGSSAVLDGYLSREKFRANGAASRALMRHSLATRCFLGARFAGRGWPAEKYPSEGR